MRQWELGAQHFQRQTGVPVSAVWDRWEQLDEAKRWKRRAKAEGVAGQIMPPPEWVGTGPVRTRLTCASDGSCMENQSTWGKNENSTWASSIYAGEGRRMMVSGMTTTDPTAADWKGILNGSAQGGEFQGVVETLQGVRTGRGGTAAGQCVVGVDNLAAMRVGANQGRSTSEPIAEWHIWLLRRQLELRGWQVAFLHWRGHSGIGMNEEVDGFAKDQHQRQQRRWEARQAQPHPDVGHVTPPDPLRGSCSSISERGNGGGEDEIPWEYQPDGGKRPGMQSLIYSSRRARSWMPATWNLPGGAGTHAEYPMKFWSRAKAFQDVGTLAEHRGWIGGLRTAEVPIRWLWSIEAAALNESPTPVRLARNGWRPSTPEEAAPVPLCNLCGKGPGHWKHLMGCGGYRVCPVVQTLAVQQQLAERGPREAARPAPAEDDDPWGEDGGPSFSQLEDDETEALREFLGPLALDDGDIAEASTDLRDAPRRGARRRRGQQRPTSRTRRALQAEGPEDEAQGVADRAGGADPAELTRQLSYWQENTPIRSWHQNLHTTRGGLMVAALHQYLLWKRYTRGSPPVDSSNGDLKRELKRLEAAWQFARRGC